MPAVAWPALGSTLSYSTDSGATWVSIGQVTSVSKAGGGEVGERDTTNLSSTSKTRAPTIPDAGELTFEVNFDPTDTAHIQLRAWAIAPPATIPQWKFTPATTASHSATCTAFVKTFDGVNAGGVDDNLTASLTLAISGAWTIA